jgi:hypothetical protein
MFLFFIVHNVLELPVVRFETVVYRNATNKDKSLVDFCKAKINVFREATLFAKALFSARITGRCCYALVLLFSLFKIRSIYFSVGSNDV